MKCLWTTFALVFVVSEISFALNSEDGDSKDKYNIDVNNTLCKTVKCVMKCCPIGKYLSTKRTRNPRRRICVPLENSTKTFPEFAKEVFKGFPETAVLNFTVKAGIFEANKTFMSEGISVANNNLFNVYLTDYPTVNLEIPNAYDRWTIIPNDHFCWEYKLKPGRKTITPELFVELSSFISDKPEETNSRIYIIGMMVTCFFLLLVLVIYSLKPRLRNLHGQILMAYVASQMVAFFLLAIMRMFLYKQTTCSALTFAIYYCLVASSCWMHVMSCDIWCTFRGYVNVRPIHCRDRNKFLAYCLYALGLPLCLTAVVFIINKIDMTAKPWFVTPNIPVNGCFIEGGAKFLYLYIPMLILILCNWVFYLMTAYNVWQLSRCTAISDTASAEIPQEQLTQRQRFVDYMKLSVVMSLNWVLEVVSTMYPDYYKLFVADLYNIVIGVAIFFIFVCKREILRTFKKSHKNENLQVCIDPKEPGHCMKSF